MDGGAWWATVHGVAESGTRLKQLSTHARTPKEALYGASSLPTAEDMSSIPGGETKILQAMWHSSESRKPFAERPLLPKWQPYLGLLIMLGTSLWPGATTSAFHYPPPISPLPPESCFYRNVGQPLQPLVLLFRPVPDNPHPQLSTRLLQYSPHTPKEHIEAFCMLTAFIRFHVPM